jgi:pimeloyl-ACP methyl ester carboxylesterase
VTRSIYKSDDGRKAVLAAYDASIEGLGIPNLADRVVRTRFGETHVVVAGPHDGPPLMSFHGGNSFNAETLAWYRRLADDHHIYAPDTIGHPGRSAETRLSPKDRSYGEWARDVYEVLGIDTAPAVGTSYGAGIVLRLAAAAPERVTKAALVVPAGLVKPPIGPILRMTLPWLRYTLSPSRERLTRMLQPMFGSEPADPDVVTTVGLIFEHVHIERAMPRPATTEELRAWQAPTLVLAAEHDVFFPARRVLPRARAIIPGLVAADQIDGSGHYPSPATRELIAERVADFLA